MEDIELDPYDLGIITKTVVYKYIKSFYYNMQEKAGYFRDGIVVMSSSNISNLLIAKRNTGFSIKE